MDGTSLAIIIPSVISAVIALIALYRTVVNANTSIKVDDATLIRSNLIPTSEWLRREEAARLEREALNKRLENMESRIDLVTAENYKLKEENTQLKAEVQTLTDRTNEQDKTIRDLQQQITTNNV